jgi:hypothetical protein
VTPLERIQIDRLVRGLEDGALGCAIGVSTDQASAESLVLVAFTRTAPFVPRSMTTEELRRRLESAIKRRAPRGHPNPTRDRSSGPAKVPNTLHVRIVDAVEEHQSDELLGRKKAFFASIAGAALVGALVIFGAVRWNALAAARPIMGDTNPAVNGKEVPVQGDFWVRFTRAPSEKPSISIQPADASLDEAIWDGHTVLVSYRGLHLAHSYILTVESDYQSRYGDRGHFIRSWPFTTEGYPVLAKVTPSDGSTGVFRSGEFDIDFNHRPPVTPVVTLNPPDGSLQLGRWSGSSWLIAYSGLKPLTNYGATVAVDYGVPKANIKTTWSFSTESGAPPAGVPVVWYSTTDPNAPSDPGAVLRMVAIDWSGRPVGTMYPGSGVQQSPDGSILYRQEGSFIDEQGTVLGRSTGDYNPVFADDNRSVCQIVDRANGISLHNFWLYAGPVAGPFHPVAAYGATVEHSNVVILSCSVLNNRAVLAENGPAGIGGVVVLQLTTGRVLSTRGYPGPSTVAVSSSHDGRYLAEQNQTLDNQGQTVAFTTLIRRVSDGAIVARLTNQRVIEFSWDDSQVLVGPPFGSPGQNYVSLIQWQTGKQLWHLDGPVGPANEPIVALARPNGSDMMVATSSRPMPASLDQLWVVHADGSASMVLGGVVYPAFFGGP